MELTQWKNRNRTMRKESRQQSYCPGCLESCPDWRDSRWVLHGRLLASSPHWLKVLLPYGVLTQNAATWDASGSRFRPIRLFLNQPVHNNRFGCTTGLALQIKDLKGQAIKVEIVLLLAIQDHVWIALVIPFFKFLKLISNFTIITEIHYHFYDKSKT